MLSLDISLRQPQHCRRNMARRLVGFQRFPAFALSIAAAFAAAPFADRQAVIAAPASLPCALSAISRYSSTICCSSALFCTLPAPRTAPLRQFAPPAADSRSPISPPAPASRHAICRTYYIRHCSSSRCCAATICHATTSHRDSILPFITHRRIHAPPERCCFADIAHRLRYLPLHLRQPGIAFAADCASFAILPGSLAVAAAGHSALSPSAHSQAPAGQAQILPAVSPAFAV